MRNVLLACLGSCSLVFLVTTPAYGFATNSPTPASPPNPLLVGQVGADGATYVQSDFLGACKQLKRNGVKIFPKGNSANGEDCVHVYSLVLEGRFVESQVGASRNLYDLSGNKLPNQASGYHTISCTRTTDVTYERFRCTRLVGATQLVPLEIGYDYLGRAADGLLYEVRAQSGACSKVFQGGSRTCDRL